MTNRQSAQTIPASARHENPTAAQRALRRVYMKPIYDGNKGIFALAILVQVLLSGFMLAISWFMQQIIDLASGADTVFSIGETSILCAALLVVSVFVLLLDRKACPLFLRRAMRNYKEHAFRRITEKSISSFAGENTSTYISALTNDATAIDTGYLARVFTLVTQLITFVGAMALMLMYSPLLTLVAVLLSIAPVIGTLMMGNRMAVAEKKMSDENEGFVGQIKDLLSGFSLIKSFKAEREAIKLFSERNRQVEGARCARRRTEAMIGLIGITTGTLAQFGVFLFGAYLALSGYGVTPGVVIVFVQLMNYVLNPISEVPKILAGRKAAHALVDKLARAVESGSRREGKRVDHVLDDAIELKHISFGYEPENPVLRDVNARFEAGKSYAVVGGSGSGKSTLLSLLMGGYDGYDGQILIDGVELRSIASDSLYDLISIVQQNVFVFNSTIRDNITMFRDFDDARVREAERMSGLEPMIAAHGEDYACGENGSGLSGGERQRVSIARCLLRGTPVLLVDEATAALDAATAFEVTRAILEIPNLTRIVVTHRLDGALLGKYDEILVLRGGTVAERGTYDVLMSEKGYFYSLYTVSQSGDEA